MTEDLSRKIVKWTDNYLISSYEVDARGRASLTTLCKFMQETAYNHANHLGFGYSQLRESGLFWVLSRMLIQVNRYPRWDEKIRVRTWPSGMDRLFAFRDFLIVGEGGMPIGAAGSAWLMLDTEKRRPRRPEEFDRLTANSHLFPTGRSLEHRPGKVPPLIEPEEGVSFPVRYSDLDLYDHVNNARYVQWISDNYPKEILRRNDVAECEINFVSESKMGDHAAIYTQRVEESPGDSSYRFRHAVKRKADNKDICLAELIWRKSQP